MFKNQKSRLFVLLFIFFILGSLCESQEIKKEYCMPSTAPLYSPPPVQFRDNRIISILFKTTSEVLQELVPKPLVPNQNNLMFIYIGELNIENPTVGKYSYLEAGIGVPVAFSKTLGNYAVYLYLDKALAIVGGREIWGWPKKDAQISFIEQDGKISAKIERFGITLIAVTANLLKKSDSIPHQPDLPWFNLKIIPSVKKNAPPDVKQLTSTINVNSKTKELYSCKATLKLSSSPVDPLGNIKVLEIVDAQFKVTDFVLDYGKILFDYLAERNK